MTCFFRLLVRREISVLRRSMRQQGFNAEKKAKITRGGRRGEIISGMVVAVVSGRTCCYVLLLSRTAPLTCHLLLRARRLEERAHSLSRAKMSLSVQSALASLWRWLVLGRRSNGMAAWAISLDGDIRVARSLKISLLPSASTLFAALLLAATAWHLNRIIALSGTSLETTPSCSLLAPGQTSCFLRRCAHQVLTPGASERAGQRKLLAGVRRHAAARAHSRIAGNVWPGWTLACGRLRHAPLPLHFPHICSTLRGGAPLLLRATPVARHYLHLSRRATLATSARACRCRCATALHLRVRRLRLATAR